MWDIAWDMWQHQNLILYTHQRMHLDILRTMNEQIKAYYDQFHALPIPALARFFSVLLHTLLKDTVDSKRHWIQFIDAARLSQGPPID